MKYTDEQKVKILRKHCISQSEIKDLVDRLGNEIFICPAKHAKIYITKEVKQEDKETWKEGRLFEVLAIGGSSTHSKGESNELGRRMPNRILRRLKEKGDMTLKEKRIREQAKKFKKIAKEKDLIYKKDNTQLVIYKRLGFAKNIEDDIIFRGEIDWGPLPTNTMEFGKTITLIDIKHSGNLKSEFGPYAWKVNKGEFVNKIQAYTYLNMIKDIDFELNDILNPDNKIREALTFCGYELFRKANKEIAETIDPDNLSEDESQLFLSQTLKMINEDKISFLYWIWDSSPRKENYTVPVILDATTIAHTKETLRKAKNKIQDIIEYYNRYGKFEEILHPSLCDDCPIENCTKKKSGEFTF